MHDIPKLTTGHSIPLLQNNETVIAGMIAKYFDTSFAILNVVSAPRVIKSCLPDFHYFNQFCKDCCRDQSCCRLHVPPEFRCSWQYQHLPVQEPGRHFVPSPIMPTILPLVCSSRILPSLSSGFASENKIINAGFPRRLPLPLKRYLRLS